MFDYVILGILLLAWFVMPRDTIKSIRTIKKTLPESNENKKRALIGSYVSLAGVIGFLTIFTASQLLQMNVIPEEVVSLTTLSTALVFFFITYLAGKHLIIPLEVRAQLRQHKIDNSSL